MLIANADSKSNDASGTQMGAGQLPSAHPAFARVCCQPMLCDVRSSPTFFPYKLSSGLAEGECMSALNPLLNPCSYALISQAQVKDRHCVADRVVLIG
jgi:hypothetical protein